MRGKWRILYIAAIGAIAVVSVALRSYRISAPIADWQSFRQADTASVARGFLRFGMDPLRPRYQDLSNIQSGKDNPMGWRMVEFPVYQVIAVTGYRAWSGISIEVWLRVVTIVSSTATAVLLVLIGTRLLGPFAGVLSGGIFALLPYSIYYGRVVLPDPLSVFFAIASLYLVLIIPDRKVRQGRQDGEFWFSAASAVLAALAILAKPTAGFLLLPVPFILIAKYGISWRLIIRMAIYAVISFTPFLLWREWILRFPEGIPASDWLFNKDNIRFKGAWFYWLFSQRLGALILGYWGLIPMGLGLVLPRGKAEGWTMRLLLLGGLLYLAVFAGGNVQHDYYQIIVIPVVSLYAAKGLAALCASRQFSRISAVVLAVCCVAFTAAFSWYTIRTYYWINHPEIIEAGVAADRLLPRDAKVIAPYNGDTAFLYETNRQGWPLGFDIDKKIAMGATAYVTVSPTDNDFETRDLANRYTVLVRNGTYAIIDLTKPRSATPEATKR